MFLWQLQFLSLGLSTCPAISSLCILSEHKFLFYLKVKGSCPGISIFPMRVVKHWPRLPREAVAAPSMAGVKARLDGALSTLGWGKMSLLLARGIRTRWSLRSLPTLTILWFPFWWKNLFQPQCPSPQPAPHHTKWLRCPSSSPQPEAQLRGDCGDHQHPGWGHITHVGCSVPCIRLFQLARWRGTSGQDPALPPDPL